MRLVHHLLGWRFEVQTKFQHKKSCQRSKQECIVTVVYIQYYSTTIAPLVLG